MLSTGLGRFTVSLVLSHFGPRSQEKQERRQLSLAVTENSCDSNTAHSDHASIAMVHLFSCARPGVEGWPKWLKTEVTGDSGPNY